MVTSINLGGFTNVNGKNVLSGTSSGIDTKTLVESLATAKRLPAVKLEETITKNKDKISALTEMKNKLSSLKASLDALRNPPFGSTSTSAFAARSPFLSMTGGKTVADYVGITTDSGAPIGKYNIKINQLAKAETRQSVAFTDRTSSIVEASGGNTSGKFSAGTFQINGESVTFQEGASLNDVAAAINSVSTKSGVTASIVKFSDTDYRLIMASKNTGLSNGISISDPDSVFPVAPATTIMNVTQPPQDAIISFNGETVTRSTNKITDLIDKVTLSLYAETGTDTVTLDIDKNNQAIAESIGSFVDSYNEVRVFSAKQQQRDANGNLLSTSVLNNDPTMQTMINKMALLITGQVSISVPSIYTDGVANPTRLGDLGISITDYAGDNSDPENIIPATSNILQLDANKLNTMLESYYESSKGIFEFNFNSSSADLGVYKRNNSVTESTFKVDIDTTRALGQQAKLVGIDGASFVSSINLQFKTTTESTSLEFASAAASATNAAGTDTPGKFAAGTFQINGKNITIAEGDSLQTIADKINQTTTDSNARAKVSLNANNKFQLIVTGMAEGTNGLVINDPDGVLPTSGMLTSRTVTQTVMGPANSDIKDFNFSYTGDGTDVVERVGNLSAKNITLSIDSNAVDPNTRAKVTKIFGSELATAINMKFTPGGASTMIEGNTGTAFAGLSMIYTGDGTDEINIAMQQGIADKMFNSLSEMIDGVDKAAGLIDTAIENLQKSNDTLQASVDKIDEQIVTYREKMLDRFSALEAAISSANSLLQLLGAQADARNNG